MLVKLLFLGSSCIYPKLAEQPISEKSLLSGQLEPTNEPYAIAKIAGIKLCESYNRQYEASDETDYRSVMPTNLYGPGDNYDPMNSHVIPGLIARFHETVQRGEKSVSVWGSGKARREFLYVDDMADACIYVMNLDKKTLQENTDMMTSHINIGCGEDLTIEELAGQIAGIVGYKGKIKFDNSKPDGAPRKLLKTDLLRKLGWVHKTSLERGLEITYQDYIDNQVIAGGQAGDR